MMINTQVPNPKFAARVQAEDAKGVLTSATGGVAAAGEAIGSAFVSQAAGINSSNIVPGVVAAAETAGVGGGAAAAAAANPSTGGLLTTTGVGSAASVVGNSTGTPIDAASDLKAGAVNIEGPLDISTVGTGGAASILNTDLYAMASGSGGSVAPSAIGAAPQSVLPAAAGAWTLANPSVGATVLGAALAIPLAITRSVGKLIDRATGLFDPS